MPGSVAPTARRADARAQLVVMIATVVALHLIGWGVLVGLVAPLQLPAGDGIVFGVGVGLTAYLLGARHAMDADHIAAIDNSVRKMIETGQRPISAGFWFSLGHSSVVFGMCALLAAGVRAAVGLVDDSNAVRSALGIVGATVSGTFLWVIGLVNLVLLVRTLRAYRRHRATGEPLDPHSGHPAGPLARLLRPVLRAVARPWHMYVVGLLFGLGFDTATSVSLMVLTATGAAGTLPWYAILTLPVIFAAGMALVDGIDSVAMTGAYRWAFDNPRRRVTYNVVITGLSAIIALGVGTVTLAGLAAEHLDVHTGPLASLAGVNLDLAGFAIAGLLVTAWLISVVVWRTVGHRPTPDPAPTAV